MKANKKFSMLNYFKQKKITTFLYVFFTALCYSLSILATYKISQFLELISAGDFHNATICFLITAIFIVLSRISIWISCIYFYNLGAHLSTSIKRDLLNRCINFTSQSFNKIPSGKLNTRIVSDTESIVWAMDGLVEALAQAVSGFIAIIFIASYNIWIGLIILVTIGLLIILEAHKQKLWSKNTKALHKTTEHISTYSNEIIRSEKDIKSLNMEKAIAVQSKDTLEEYNKNFRKRFHTNSNLWCLRSGIVDVVVIGMVFLSIVLLKNAYLGISAFLFIILNKDKIQEVIWSLGQITENLNTCKIASKRIGALMDEDQFATEKFGTTNLETCVGEITFKNVSFSYVEQEEQDDDADDDKKVEPKITKKQVFTNFNMNIPANKTVALVGKSGCGKSTILNLIPKLYTADSGEVLIDGINVNDLTRESIRSNISLVSQFPYIFDTTIRKNLLLAKPDATDDEIASVVKKSNMDFLADLPKGLDTVVGEGGIRLSGGQKQRLAIARALLRNTKIILFDESTSSLDNFSQNEIKKSIDALSHNSTVVIVAHRLSTIKNADIIYFIDNGEIEAQGTFDELFENNEKFQKLFVAENI